MAVTALAAVVFAFLGIRGWLSPTFTPPEIGGVSMGSLFWFAVFGVAIGAGIVALGAIDPDGGEGLRRARVQMGRALKSERERAQWKRRLQDWSSDVDGQRTAHSQAVWAARVDEQQSSLGDMTVGASFEEGRAWAEAPLVWAYDGEYMNYLRNFIQDAVRDKPEPEQLPELKVPQRTVVSQGPATQALIELWDELDSFEGARQLPPSE